MFQSSLQFCGLVYGPQEHHLDHIATLCAILDIPLVVTDEEIEKQAKLYYPQLVLFFFPYLIAANYLIQNYDVIITAMPTDMFESIFFLAKKIVKKRPVTVWCPHGNSDKGHDSFFMSALNKENILLIYGDKMLDFFKSKNALSPSCHIRRVGNYRYEFYQKHKALYQKMFQAHIAKKLQPNTPTYLYAPTWNDHEKASSFHLAIPHLLETLPKEINLIVKFHPNTLLEEDLKIKKLIWKYESEPNVVFIEHMPLIYPILDFVTLYIGDTSSIGYDFLSFNKPMFFLNVLDTLPPRPLYACGTVISKEDFSHIYDYIAKNLQTDESLFAKKRLEMHQYTFSKETHLDRMLHDLTHICNKLRYDS